jgi:hypothetical protein
MRMLLSVIALSALLAGCGGSDPEPPPAVAPATETEEPNNEHELDLSGYSPGVREYYGGAHEHADTEMGNAEAEYHQPPKPAEAKLGEPIELTGTEIGVRFKVTPTKVAPVGKDLMAVYLTLKSTGVTIYDRPMEMASITYPGELPTPLDTEATAKCSNGFDDILRIDVSRSRKGCLLFPRSGNKQPERFQLALEVVPTLAGGIWHLR